MTEEIVGNCPHCGAGFSPGSMYCHYCGNVLPVLPGVPAPTETETTPAPASKKTAISPSTGLSYEPYEGRWYIAPFVNKVRRYKVYMAHRKERLAIEKAALYEYENEVRLDAKKAAIRAKYAQPGALEPWYKKVGTTFMGFGQAWSEYGKRVQEREAAFKKKQEEDREKRAR